MALRREFVKAGLESLQNFVEKMLILAVMTDTFCMNRFLLCTAALFDLDETAAFI